MSKLLYTRFTKKIINHFLSNNKSTPRRSSSKLHSSQDDQPITKLSNTVKGDYKFGMKIPDTMISDAIKKLEGYKFYMAKKVESENAKTVDELEEQHVSAVKSGRGKGFICYDDQVANVPTSLKIDVVPRKTRSQTLAQEIVAGDDDDDDDESSDDDEDDDDDVEEDEDEKEDEEHLALTDSVPPPVYRTTTKMSIRPQTPVPFLSEAEVDRLLSISTPPPSPLTSYSSPLPQIPSPPLPASPTNPLGYRAAMIWLRADYRTIHYILAPRSETPPSGTPPLLPILLPTSSPPLLLLSTDCKADVPEDLEEHFRADRVLVRALKVVPYEIAKEIPATDVAELSQRMTDFVTTTQMAALNIQQRPARDPAHLDVLEEAGNYALWDVIENGNSFKLSAKTTTNADGTSTTLIPGPVTTEENVQKKNDMKARNSKEKDSPKQMYENFSAPSTESLDSIFNRLQKIVSQLAILGENISQEDLNLKFLRSLPSEWNTHVVFWRNKPDLDIMSFDYLYNNFKIVEQQVKGTASSSSSSQNMAFVSSPSSTNEVNTAYGVSTANIQASPTSTQVSIASTQVSTPNLSDDTKTGRKININGSDTAGYNKSKVECFNYHKLGHFVWECRGSRNQDSRNRNQDNSRRTVNVEETSFKAMLAIDGAEGVPKHLSYEGYGPKPSKSVIEDTSNEVKESPDAPLANCNYHQRERVVSGNNYTRVNYNYSAKKTHPSAQRNMVPRAVLMKTGLRSLNTARPVNTAHPKTTVYSARPMSHFSKSAQSTVKRPYQTKTTLTNKNSSQKVNTAKGKFYTARPKIVNTTRPNSAVVNVVRANQVNPVKASACWVWRPTKLNSASITLKKHNYVDARGAKGGKITGKGTLKTSKLDFEDVYFVKELQFNLFYLNSQMCDKKNIVLFTNTGCFVLSSDFKLADEKCISSKPHNKTPMKLFRVNEGFFVGYSLNSKAFRVYNIRTRKVEENLHIRFLEDKPIIAGTKESVGTGHSSKETGSSQDYILMPLWKDGSLFGSSQEILQ
ncbi:ribonuclease H-like domain-containing protein [Tanacetum coccineum]